MRRARVALVLLAALAPPAAAQFDLLAWTTVKNGDGWASASFDGDQLTVNGPSYADPCLQTSVIYVQATAPFDATVAVRMDFFPDDIPGLGFDAPMYVLNGVQHLLQDLCDGCEVVFHVQAGDAFGLGNWSKDCLFGTSVSVWSGLRLYPDPGATQVVAGAAISDAFGQAVAGVGDLDFDGVPDVAVGAPHASANGPDSGRLVVLSGADAAPLFAVNGPAEHLQFGYAVTGVGDVTGDGVPDLLVGAPDASFGGSQAGRTYLLSGAGGGIVGVRDGENPGAHLGRSMDGAGDVNADGVPDLLVGAPGSNAAGTGAGRAMVLSGKSAQVLVALGGPAPGDQCGAAVAGGTDLDGDGVPDLLAGSPLSSPGGLLHAGLVRAASGAGGAVQLTLAGAVAGGQLGSSVAWLGDADGDGVPDVLAGAPYTDAALVHVGAVTASSGADGAPLFSLLGSHAGDALGWSVAGPGDVDDDGVPDALVGAIGSGGPDPGAAGSARLLSGRSGEIVALLGGQFAGDQFGAAVAGVGDLDGDGLPDMAVGTPGLDQPAQNAGAIMLLAGLHPTWTDLGGGLAGAAGLPDLAGKGLLVGGGAVTLTVQRALPGAPLTLVVGLAAAAAPFKGGVLWPQPDVLLVGLAADSRGNLVLGADWPAGVPSGLSAWFQAWIADAAAAHGLSATNGLRGTAP